MSRYIKWLIATINISVLVGCGGGGGGGTPTYPTATFTEVPNALSITYPTGTSSVVAVVPIDINSDGKDDLVVHYLGSTSWALNVGNVEAINKLKIYIQQTDGAFADQTTTYLEGDDTLGGWSRKAKIVDVNGDGKKDVIYAINQEDGRVANTPSDMNAQIAMLVSNGTKYTVKKFGDNNWYHSVGFGIDSLNQMFVTGAGYTTNTVIQHTVSNNTLLASSLDINLSPNAFEFFNSAGTSSWTNLLLQASNSLDYLGVDGFSQSTDGTWNRLSSLKFSQASFPVTQVSYNGDTAPWVAYQLGDKYVSFAGITETCQIKLVPGGENVIVFALSGSLIPNFQSGMTVELNKLQTYRVSKAAKISNGQIIEVPLNINDEQTNNMNANFFDCKDVNADGYADIVVYPYTSTGLPHVYLNNKNSGFNYIGTAQFPEVQQVDKAWTSILHDFDGDGIKDLMVYPSTATSTKWRYYKGQKNLQ